MKTYLVVIFGAAAIAMIATFIVIKIARYLRLVDSPGTRKVHNVAVPRIGGTAIVVGMMTMIVPVIALDNTIGDSFRNAQSQILALLAGGIFIFLVGLLDDLKGLRARTKLLAQIIASLGVFSCGVFIDEIRLPGAFTFQLGWMSLPVTILWIVSITNALNLIDGLDGLAAGIAAIACAAIGTLAILTGQSVMAVLMLAMLGSLCGFLFFNYNPAKIFMGDSGSLFIGFVLGSTSVLSAHKTATIVGLAIPLVALGVPVFDMLFSMLRRILERRSCFAPDRGHIHHRLLDSGLSHRRVVTLLYIVTIVATGMGMLMIAAKNIEVVAVFCIVIALLIGVFRIVGAVRLRESIASMRRNFSIAREVGEERRNFEESQLCLREVAGLEDWWVAVCKAAGDLNFAALSMKTTDRDGTENVLMWRNTNGSPADTKLLRLEVPMQDRRSGPPLYIEGHIYVDNSLEAAGRRGALFSRLVDEYSVAKLPRKLGNPRAASMTPNRHYAARRYRDRAQVPPLATSSAAIKRISPME